MDTTYCPTSLACSFLTYSRSQPLMHQTEKFNPVKMHKKLIAFIKLAFDKIAVKDNTLLVNDKDDENIDPDKLELVALVLEDEDTGDGEDCSDEEIEVLFEDSLKRKLAIFDFFSFESVHISSYVK